MAKILIEGLAGDSGCQIACIGLHEKLVDIVAGNEVVYAPTLIDARDIPDNVDIAIIEGGVRTDREEELAKEIRKKAKVVVAIGSCACFGGIPGLANLEDGGDLLKEIYSDHRGTTQGLIPRHLVVLPSCKGISDFIKVDYMIPGCPPELHDIEYVLTTLLKGEVLEMSKTQVCDDCPRVRKGEYTKTLKRIHEEIPDPERCLLEQGYLCVGPATRAGCGAPCPKAGNICDGCRGPCEGIDDQGLAMLDSLTALAKEITDDYTLQRYSGMFHRFTFADSSINRLARRDKR